MKAIGEGEPELARDRMAALLQDSIADVRREMERRGIAKAARQEGANGGS